MDCIIDGCLRPAQRAGYCWGHVKRKQRKATVQVELAERNRGSWRNVMEAFWRLTEIDASDGKGYAAAIQNLRVAIYRYYRSQHQPNQHTKGSKR